MALPGRDVAGMEGNVLYFRWKKSRILSGILALGLLAGLSACGASFDAQVSRARDALTALQEEDALSYRYVLTTQEDGQTEGYRYDVSSLKSKEQYYMVQETLPSDPVFTLETATLQGKSWNRALTADGDWHPASAELLSFPGLGDLASLLLTPKNFQSAAQDGETMHFQISAAYFKTAKKSLAESMREIIKSAPAEQQDFFKIGLAVLESRKFQDGTLEVTFAQGQLQSAVWDLRYEEADFLSLQAGMSAKEALRPLAAHAEFQLLSVDAAEIEGQLQEFFENNNLP